MKRVTLAVIIAVGIMLLVPALAGASTPTLAQLAKTVAALQKKVNSQGTRLAAQERQLAGQDAKLAGQATLIAAQSTIISAQTGDLATLSGELKTLSGDLGDADATLAEQTARIEALLDRLTASEGKLDSLQTVVDGQAATLTDAGPVLALAPYVSLTTAAMNDVAGPNIVFQGVNVHVRSASGENDTSGLGNLIVGWDDQPIPVLKLRTGSNNLVVGRFNSFTS
jgi:uncharacterized coiled-coil protein SlyX